jgi:prepilin-type N-terminal cleavage/methylation domain-containing protein
MKATSIRKRESKGFTLLEILVCLALMAITFVSVFRLQAQNLDMQRETRFITEAKYLAQGRLAHLYVDGPGFSRGASRTLDPPFQHLVVYEETQDEVADHKDLYRVRIVIHSRDDRNGDQQYVLETYVFQSPE